MAKYSKDREAEDVEWGTFRAFLFFQLVDERTGTCAQTLLLKHMALWTARIKSALLPSNLCFAFSAHFGRLTLFVE